MRAVYLSDDISVSFVEEVSRAVVLLNDVFKNCVEAETHVRRYRFNARKLAAEVIDESLIGTSDSDAKGLAGDNRHANFDTADRRQSDSNMKRR